MNVTTLPISGCAIMAEFAVEMNVVTAMKRQASTNRLIRPSPFLETRD
jgi:hypothetical protein